ncbi:flagellar brake protein [Thermovorax subterraneus]|jgi:c-di-GMP-binding flagellar brake protein YcgR|nr:flagellar brake protein [Thermovorax subterraneus]
MKNSILEIGMRVEIEVERDKQKILLPSKVEDIENERYFLGMPFFEGKIFFLESEETIKIYFAKNNSFYYIQGKVVEKKYAPIPVIGVVLDGKPEKNQRRNYFRVQVMRRIKLRPIDSDSWMKAFLVDLSASGALIYFGRQLEKGDFVELKLPLDFKELELKARVVRIEKDQLRRVQQYNVGVQFIDISEQQRDDIIKFVLAEQRKLRQKGYI